MLYSKTAQYSIQSMLFIAANHSEHNILVRDIADALQLPSSFLSKILQVLSRYGFLTSVKGPRGGFALSEKGAYSTIQQVAEVIDGPMDFDGCLAGFTPCDAEHACPIHDQWVRVREDIRTVVGKKTIMKLAQEMPEMYKRVQFLEEPGENPKAARKRKSAARETKSTKKMNKTAIPGKKR